MSFEHPINFAEYLETEFAGVELEFAHTQDFNVVRAAEMVLRMTEQKNEAEQACISAEHDEACLRSLDGTTFEAVSDARIALGREAVAREWTTPISGTRIVRQHRGLETVKNALARGVKFVIDTATDPNQAAYTPGTSPAIVRSSIRSQ